MVIPDIFFEREKLESIKSIDDIPVFTNKNENNIYVKTLSIPKVVNNPEYLEYIIKQKLIEYIDNFIREMLDSHSTFKTDMYLNICNLTKLYPQEQIMVEKVSIMKLNTTYRPVLINNEYFIFE